ncbi:MAG: polysaccharide deacetylase family protein [Candidatus Saganbacteria bacterium]|nr:polysaccharide deacetylase family protein [Candidatus Saganbacteria bacterium]
MKILRIIIILIVLILLLLGIIFFLRAGNLRLNASVSKFIPSDKEETATFSRRFPDSIVITIDLCPSSKPYNKELFDYLDTLSKKLGYPIPVAICPSGTWILKHADELAKIKSLDLDIAWVNHSYSHPVDRDFLNNPKINFKYEVEENLKIFKKYGLKPSKYFRFPGLRSNKKRLKELAEMGYIPLGANAWLAKGQKIKNGSIILVHGNGNELQGCLMLINYLKEHEQDLIDGKIKIVSI